MKDKDIKHLEWVYERMKCVHNENENYDYMIRFREILEALRKQDVVGRSEQFSCPFPETKGCDRHKIDDEEGRWEFCNTCKREWAR
jgi:hypothetical protein